MWRTSFQIWKSERSVLLVNAVTIWPLAPNAAEAEYPDLDLNQGLNLRRVQFEGIRRELNPYLLLHRQACLPRTPRTP